MTETCARRRRRRRRGRRRATTPARRARGRCAGRASRGGGRGRRPPRARLRAAGADERAAAVDRDPAAALPPAEPDRARRPPPPDRVERHGASSARAEIHARSPASNATRPRPRPARGAARAGWRGRRRDARALRSVTTARVPSGEIAERTRAPGSRMAASGRSVAAVEDVERAPASAYDARAVGGDARRPSRCRASVAAPGARARGEVDRATPRPAATYAREPSAAVATSAHGPGSASRAAIWFVVTSSSAACGRLRPRRPPAPAAAAGARQAARRRHRASQVPNPHEPTGLRSLNHPQGSDPLETLETG